MSPVAEAAQSSQAIQATPNGTEARIQILDVLRGFALFGILLINLSAFKSAGGPPGFAYEGGLGDRLVVWSLLVFVESKFFTLFSLLFGVGFSLQFLRAQQRGVRFIPIFVRRLLVLSLFGVAHIVLLWEGDILLLYALVGFILLPFRHASGRRLLNWVLVLLLIPLLLFSVGLVTITVARRLPGRAAQMRQADADISASFVQGRAESLRLISEGSYGELLAERVQSYRQTSLLLLTRVPSVLAMFLLGLYVGKTNILREVNSHLLLLRRVRCWGLSLGLLLSLTIVIAYVRLEPLSAIVALFFNQALAGPLLSLGYAATLVLAMHTRRHSRLCAALAATGRMSLTNYLLQSCVCALLFSGYGLGLVGRVKPAQGILLAVGIYVMQMALSCWWLERFRFGLVEWLWRSLTYLRLQPLTVKQ